MAGNEPLGHPVAHNLVRSLIAETVACHRVELWRVSYKGRLDALCQLSDAISRARNCKMRGPLPSELLLTLARDLAPLRSDRTEPRAIKR